MGMIQVLQNFRWILKVQILAQHLESLGFCARYGTRCSASLWGNLGHFSLLRIFHPQHPLGSLVFHCGLFRGVPKFLVAFQTPAVHHSVNLKQVNAVPEPALGFYRPEQDIFWYGGCQIRCWNLTDHRFDELDSAHHWCQPFMLSSNAKDSYNAKEFCRKLNF